MSTKTQVQPRCRECRVELTEDMIRRIGRRIGLCDDCRAKQVAAWQAEHTRKSGDTRKGWLIGDECSVTLKGTTYQAKILDMDDRADGDYLWTKLELTTTVKGFGNEPITRTWVHPEPVQSYKLKKRQPWKA